MLNFRLWLMVFVKLFLALGAYDSNNIKSEDISISANITGIHMILTCHVPQRQNQLNIFLDCPLASTICKENCKKSCNNQCPLDEKINCIDNGFDKHTAVYTIDYIINPRDPRNKGPWKCRYKGVTSNAININPSAFPAIPIEPPVKDKNLIDVDKLTLPPKYAVQTKPREIEAIKTELPHSQVISSNNAKSHYTDILTTSQFVLSVIVLLVCSLFLNVVFCSRIVCRKLARQKSQKSTSQSHHMMRDSHRDPDSQSNIYGHAAGTINPSQYYARQMSLLTKINQANGAYVAPSSLGGPTAGAPTNASCYPTLLLHNGPTHDSSSAVSSQHTNSVYGDIPGPPQSDIAVGGGGGGGGGHYTNYVPQHTSSQMYLSFYPQYSASSLAGSHNQHPIPPIPPTTTMIQSSVEPLQPATSINPIATPSTTPGSQHKWTNGSSPCTPIHHNHLLSSAHNVMTTSTSNDSAHLLNTNNHPTYHHHHH